MYSVLKSGRERWREGGGRHRESLAMRAREKKLNKDKYIT